MVMATTAALARFSLAGRRALVTGAGRGIGRELALGLAAAGARVVVAARTAGEVDRTVELIAQAGGEGHAAHLDTADIASCAAAVTRTTTLLGGIDLLINNAGTEQVRASLDVDEDLWDRILDTNLKGAFFCSQAAARAMGAGGAIINLCSLTSAVGVPTAAAYGASKSGLLGLTRALAAEWAPRGIRVNGIAPGYFRTALTEAFYADPAWQAAMLPKIPMGRFGELDDLVGTTVFLASDAARYVTGQCLYVDGGYMASI